MHSPVMGPHDPGASQRQQQPPWQPGSLAGGRQIGACVGIWQHPCEIIMLRDAEWRCLITCGVRQRAVSSSRMTSNTLRKKFFLQHMSASNTTTSSVAGIAARPSLCPLYMTLQRALFRLPDLPLISPAPRVLPDTYLHRTGGCTRSSAWV